MCLFSCTQCDNMKVNTQTAMPITITNAWPITISPYRFIDGLPNLHYGFRNSVTPKGVIGATSLNYAGAGQEVSNFRWDRLVQKAAVMSAVITFAMLVVHYANPRPGKILTFR